MGARLEARFVHTESSQPHQIEHQNLEQLGFSQDLFQNPEAKLKLEQFLEQTIDFKNPKKR
jgi:hypothetical protein